MTKLPWNHRLAAVASLGDESRRRLFDFVASAADAVGRDDAAQAVGLARSTASFHLDRLVKDGLLAVEFRKLGGREGPGSGRPAKLYRAAVDEVAASVPDRHYDLAAELLVSAIEDATSGGGSPREALLRAARARGQSAGESAARAAGREPAGATGARHADFAGSPDGAGGPDGPGPFANFLAGQGYCPADDGGGGLVLLNCPFHRLAAGHADVVCAMNGAFLGGASMALGIDPTRIEALAIEDLREQGAARPGQCCARILPS
ncbi:Predicted transcriptional regulator, ArsR family [Arthrobacter sp. 49Tsu3.1M3]|jgi:predicted ArsR family transcriptional regulator|uniref:helix-turn-helix transcriptional regulator n=1 Tax=Arthrobacter sp. 49Tsu3.1M3 TaxID=1279029 RepID=UPI0009A8D611|nr:transcriptional regulator [Arthrobacter sp. 49Tsu3.1M3]SKB76134.1 Predicted transcriptional regulator, ArsR family [Arthrobacter sp. 49Tsu3.1M3]